MCAETHGSDEEAESCDDGGDGEGEPGPGDMEIGFPFAGGGVGGGGEDGGCAETVCACVSVSGVYWKGRGILFGEGPVGMKGMGAGWMTDAFVMLMARLSRSFWRPSRPASCW